MRLRHSTEPGELRPRDRRRTAEVFELLHQHGIPSGDPTIPAWVTVHMPGEYHAVEVLAWARDADTVADRDALADRIRRILWDAGYLIHENGRGLDCTATNSGVHRNILYVYRPHWGGDLPEITLTTAGVAHVLHIDPATWRAYVARGQAPKADAPIDGRTPAWNTSTIDAWRRDRPGRGARLKGR